MVRPNNSSINHLVTMINAFSDPWGLKAPDSTHIFMNKEARRFTNTPLSFDVEGRRDGEFPASWAELEGELIEHDHQMLSTGKSSAVIETHYWFGSKFLIPYISEKHPVYNDAGDCIAILWCAKPILAIDLVTIIESKSPGIITTTLNCDLFTEAENETIFYLMRGLSAKEIARVRTNTVKTINNRIQNIFQKADVHSLSQLKAFCYEHGFANYLPPKLLKKGITLIK
ncbi:PAS fold-containing protein [Izhakiella capsodis]|uniref:PAS fold-containing protein n=1 Tax=Izhakiella capsodis TaxID=1367852 RepID=A0A1I4X4S7_9GAMM|nr:LuxR C-terminal-related transcriptional regulator [Izhakiella capsodis]SFN20897.1 PAS fold-containing protein [Izhakiella capsodis]